ncbi:hypothetical protein [Sphingobium nicotianae]|uniref:Molecular chaperone n=1 Tax=Sphingobium nicotianae TaxID=2782607 RepID=A0A9X1ISI2_9SPHN|nr:hypothetical protein [Sphingobium nicotianae]MBT2188324.1 hypothetical protein [Sphingobium nicotianae]
MVKAKSGKRGFMALLLLPTMVGPATLRAQADAVPSAVAPAAAAPAARVNLNITPKRLSFSRNSRSASVYVFNQGNRAATVDVSIVERVMLPTGEIKTLDDALANAEAKPFAERLRSARGLVVATPRRIVLAPGKGQTVRLRVTPPANADAPEYRSHLTVATVPPRNTGLTAEDAAAQRSGELSFRLTAVFGLSIPIILRTGTPDVRADIRNVRLDEETISPDGVGVPRRTPILAFDLDRLGGSSLFGNIEIRSAAGRKDVIGLARGVGVYPEIDSRAVRIPLQRRPTAGETLDVTFVDDDLTPGRVVAKASLTAS